MKPYRPEDCDAAGEAVGVLVGQVRSVATLLDQARQQHPQHPAIETEKGSWTYEELFDRAGKIARLLQDDGVVRGDRVAILLPNSPSWVFAYLGALRAGAIPVPLDPSSSEPSLGTILPDCSPRALICDPELLPRLAKAAVATPSLKHAYAPALASRSTEGFPLLVRDLDALPDGDGSEPDPVVRADDDVTLIIYTSGTTDVPKGVMLTHRNLHSLIDSGVQTFALDQGDRIGHVLPLCHLYGLREVLAPIAVAGTLVMTVNPMFPAALLRWFASRGVTALPGVPAHFSLFLGRYRELLWDLGRHLRYVLIGTSPTSPTLLEQLREALPGVKIYKTYGLTECGRVTTGDFTSPETPFDSVGLPAPGVVLSFRDPEGDEVEPGTPGRVYITSDMVMEGYWGRPDDTAAVKVGPQCFKSRDLGFADAQGLCHLVGRVDQMINVGGEKVAPWEVEMVLKGHPEVEDAAVVGEADPGQVTGEVGKAYVVLANGARAQEADLQQHCSRHLEPYKVPRSFVFLPKLPKTSLGKTSLHELRKMAK